MIRTQIQLPDALHARAKLFAAEREISMAEMTRRGLELFLDRFPQPKARGKTKVKKWQLPRVNVGIKVPLDQLHDIAFEEESTRSLPRR